MQLAHNCLPAGVDINGDVLGEIKKAPFLIQTYSLVALIDKGERNTNKKLLRVFGKSLRNEEACPSTGAIVHNVSEEQAAG